MHKTQKQVKEMMIALDLPLPHESGPGVKYLTSPHIDLLCSLVEEEHQEFQDAMVKLDNMMKDEAEHSLSRGSSRGESIAVKEAWVDVIDAMCDMIVTIHNTTNAMNIDLEPFFDEVHRTNMLKRGGCLNEKGKRMKPVGWKPPQLRPILDEMLSHQLDKKDK